MKAISSVLFVLLFSCFCCVSAQTSQVSAQDRSPAAEVSSSHQEQIEERQTEKKKKKSGKKEGARLTFADHPSFRIGTAVRLNFEARIETYARTPTNAIGLDQPHVAFASPRFGVTGDFFDRRIEFEVSRDPSEGPGEWKDVFVNLRRSRALELTGGRFKVPFGREMLTGRSNLDFVYRSFAAEALSPGRDVGVMAHGRLYREPFEVSGGILRARWRQCAYRADEGRTRHHRGANCLCAVRLEIRLSGVAGARHGVRRQPSRHSAWAPWRNRSRRRRVLRSCVRQWPENSHGSGGTLGVGPDLSVERARDRFRPAQRNGLREQ